MARNSTTASKLAEAASRLDTECLVLDMVPAAVRNRAAGFLLGERSGIGQRVEWNPRCPPCCLICPKTRHEIDGQRTYCETLAG